MRTKLIVGCALAALGVAGAVWWNRSAEGVTPATATEPGASAATTTPVTAQPANTTRRCVFPDGMKLSYAYRATVESAVAIQGTLQPVQNTVTATATLALEVLRHDGDDAVLIAQLAAPNDEYVALQGKAIAEPFLMKIEPSCAITAFGRHTKVPLKTAQAQQVAVSDFIFKVPAAGSIDETYQNGIGVAKARFTVAQGVVSRTITKYEMAWRSKSTFNVDGSTTRITLGDQWIESLDSSERFSGGMLVGVKMNVSLNRERDTTTLVAENASRLPTDYEWANLLSASFADGVTNVATAAVPPAEQRYVAAMKDRSMEDAFSGMLERLEARTNIEDQWHEMAGFLNGHPEAIDDFAVGLRQPDFPPAAKAVSYLVLSKTVHAEARDALLELRRDVALPPADRLRASLALVTRKDVGVALAREMRSEALTAQSVDAVDDLLPRNSLLHLGVLAATHKTDAETFAVARETIKSRLQGAGDDLSSLSPALGAAGNLADPSLLSTIQTYTVHPDYHVRLLAPKALRGYAYAETELFIAEWLSRETSPDVKEEIFDVVVHQLADAKRTAGMPVALEALRHLKMKPMVLARQSIIHILGPLKNEAPAFKAALLTQMAEEFRAKSGLYSQIVNYLAPAEIELGLSMMPEFAHQYGPADRTRAEAVVKELEAATAAEANRRIELEMP